MSEAVQENKKTKPSDDILLKHVIGYTEWATMDNGRRVIVDVSDRTSRDYKPTLIDGGWYPVNKKRFTLDSQLAHENAPTTQKQKKFKKKVKKKKQPA